MCLKWVKKPKLNLPYPEEVSDYTQTLETVDVESVINQWLTNYHVPSEYHGFWRTQIEVKVTLETAPYPAWAFGAEDKRHLWVHPAWLNCGVVAHEQAHNSYALLTESEKQLFSLAYNPLKTTDPLIKLLYSKNKYGLSSNIEGHAECYRYLGNKLPEELKPYYPKLF